MNMTPKTAHPLCQLAHRVKRPRRLIRLVLTAVFALSAVPLPAQLSESQSGGFDLTGRVTGTLDRVDQERGEIFVERSDGLLVRFAVTKNTKLRADRDSPRAGRGKLAIADLAAGLMVKVSYRNDQPGNATFVRVMRQPEASVAPTAAAEP